MTGEHAITVIAFVGSVFSPAYFRARRRSVDVDAAAYCGFNVAVHGPRGSAWAMTEYRGRDVERTADTLVLGRNRIVRGATGIRIDIDERTTPWGRPLRGCVRLQPRAWMDRRFALDDAARHLWWPVAPRASITVELEAPALRLDGVGYHDCNGGNGPLELAFAGWTWSRVAHGDRTTLLYDVDDLDDGRREIGLVYRDDGGVEAIDASRSVGLGTTRWGLARTSRVAERGVLTAARTLVDSPFYARSLVTSADAIGVHEVVDLRRFVRRSTQLMLPFRVRGVGWW